MKLRRFSASAVALLAAWFVLSVLSACRQTPSDPVDPPVNRDSCCGGAIVLSVHDSATDDHLMKGTYVLTGNGTTQTQHVNDHGQVVFTHLCPGRYEVVGEADGYNRHVQGFELGCNDEKHADFNMSPAHHEDDCCHGVIKIILRDSATGDALSGGTVRLYKGSTLIGEQTIRADGNAWDGLCQGDGYSISVSKEGYNHYESNIDALGCNEHRTTDRRIGAVRHETNCDDASITLAVMDSVHRDMPVSGASVTITINGRNDVHITGTTNDHGHFTANHLLGHTTYAIRVAKDGFGVREFIWQLTDCKEYTESVWLAPR